VQLADFGIACVRQQENERLKTKVRLVVMMMMMMMMMIDDDDDDDDDEGFLLLPHAPITWCCICYIQAAFDWVLHTLMDRLREARTATAPPSS
jgi:hypothetical protein